MTLGEKFFFFLCHFLQAAHFDGLEADDGGDGGNGFRRVGPRDIGRRFGQTGENLSVSAPAEDGGQLAGNVAAVEVGKDENIGPSGHGAGNGFSPRRPGQKGGVGLEFTVNFDCEVAGLRLLPREGGGRGNFSLPAVTALPLVEKLSRATRGVSR